MPMVGAEQARLAHARTSMPRRQNTQPPAPATRRTRSRTAPAAAAAPAPADTINESHAIDAERAEAIVARAAEIASRLRADRPMNVRLKYEEVFGRPPEAGTSKTELARQIGLELAAREAADEARAAQNGASHDTPDAAPETEGSPMGPAAPDSEAHAAASSDSTRVPLTGADDNDADASSGRPRGWHRNLTIEQLQEVYRQTVGRPSGSTHRAYLIWKIREVDKGRIRVGPTLRAREEGEVDYMVLPLRLPRTTVAELDAAWRRRGYRSRTQLQLLACGTFMRSIGETAIGDALIARASVDAESAAADAS
jgi:hypothetical protein